MKHNKLILSLSFFCFAFVSIDVPAPILPSSGDTTIARPRVGFQGLCVKNGDLPPPGFKPLTMINEKTGALRNPCPSGLPMLFTFGKDSIVGGSSLKALYYSNDVTKKSLTNNLKIMGIPESVRRTTVPTALKVIKSTAFKRLAVVGVVSGVLLFLDDLEDSRVQKALLKIEEDLPFVIETEPYDTPSEPAKVDNLLLNKAPWQPILSPILPPMKPPIPLHQ